MPFNLDSLDNQIHLTNNAIQRNFDISEHCHEEIPEEKMWYCDELDTYLKPGIHKRIYKPINRRQIFERFVNPW